MRSRTTGRLLLLQGLNRASKRYCWLATAFNFPSVQIRQNDDVFVYIRRVLLSFEECPNQSYLILLLTVWNQCTSLMRRVPARESRMIFELHFMQIIVMLAFRSWGGRNESDVRKRGWWIEEDGGWGKKLFSRKAFFFKKSRGDTLFAISTISQNPH